MAEQELTHKKIFAVFLPAILLGSLALFIQIVRYQPLFPTEETTSETENKTLEITTLPDDPVLGNKRAPYTVIAFEDFSCGACEAQHALFLELQKQFPDKVKIIWKGLPVHDFPYPSIDAIRHGYCAAEQNKFNEFASFAFANSTNLIQGTLAVIADEIALDPADLTSCLSSSRPDENVGKNKQIAQILQVQSVPTFFVNNIQIETPQTIEDWKQLFGL